MEESSGNASSSHLLSKRQKKKRRRAQKDKYRKDTSLRSSFVHSEIEDSCNVSVDVLKNAVKFNKSNSDIISKKEPETEPANFSNEATRFESINISDTNPELLSVLEKLNVFLVKNSQNTDKIKWVILTSWVDRDETFHVVASVESLASIHSKKVDSETKLVKIFVIHTEENYERHIYSVAFFKTDDVDAALIEVVDSTAIDDMLNEALMKLRNCSAFKDEYDKSTCSLPYTVSAEKLDIHLDGSYENSSVMEIFVTRKPSDQSSDSAQSSLQSPESTLLSKNEDSASKIDFPCKTMPSTDTSRITEHQRVETKRTSPVTNVPSPTRIQLAQSLQSLASQEITGNSQSTTYIELSDFANRNQRPLSSSKPEYRVHVEDVPVNENMHSQKNPNVHFSETQPKCTQMNEEYERPFFYISSSEIKYGELPTASGSYQTPTQGPEDLRYIEEIPLQEPRRCLGSQRCHYIILTVGVLGAIIGCVIYHLQDYGIGPYALRPIGASTAFISFIICVISSIYLRYLSRHSNRLLPLNYEPIDGTNSSSPIQNYEHPGGYWNDRGQWVPQATPGYYQNSNEGTQPTVTADKGACGESLPEAKEVLSDKPSTSGYNQTSGSKNESAAGRKDKLKNTGTNVNQQEHQSSSEDDIFTKASFNPNNGQGNNTEMIPLLMKK